MSEQPLERAQNAIDEAKEAKDHVSLAPFAEDDDEADHQAPQEAQPAPDEPAPDEA